MHAERALSELSYALASQHESLCRACAATSLVSTALYVCHHAPLCEYVSSCLYMSVLSIRVLAAQQHGGRAAPSPALARRGPMLPTDSGISFSVFF